MQTENFSFDGALNTQLPAVLWLPDSRRPRLILQICHGMTEHAGRFSDLAAFLTEQGIGCAGFDLRGHGRNPGDPDTAHMNGTDWEASLEDLHLFGQLLERRFPEIPRVMLGFSLGSFLLREYLNHYEAPAGAAILGTGRQPVLILSILLAIVGGQCRKFGPEKSTPLVRKLSFGAYNRRFSPSRTPCDWLCSDEEALSRYQEDPLCRKTISAGLFYQLLSSMKRTEALDSLANWDRHMPVLLLSGLEDPVGDFGKGVQRIGYVLTELAGFSHVEIQLIPQARHDVLHEVRSGAADLAKKKLLDWLDRIS